MEGLSIRLKSITIRDFKNIKDSTIEFENNDLNCVTGIYGPNGSGKTAVIDIIYLFKCLASQKEVHFPYYYVRKGSNTSILKFDFNYRGYKLKYEASFSINTNTIEKYAEFHKERFQVYEADKLKYSFRIDRSKESVKDSIALSINGKDNGLKAFEFEKLVAAYSICKNDSKSFVFTGLVDSIKDQDLYKDIYQIMYDFNFYATVKMTVISIKESYGIAVRDEIPLHLDYIKPHRDGILHTNGIIRINLLGENLIPLDYVERLKLTINQCNEILVCLLNNMHISMNIDDMIVNDNNGVQCKRVSFNSSRNDLEIPLIYESEGIKKLISMATAFIAVFNNANALVAIDELDAGIFEILLGEIVKVLSERGKGQFIFTSHNLRVLEVVDPKAITIARMTDTNKFVKFPYVRPSNNFRNLYLRALVLEADKNYYSGIDDMKIALALRSAYDEDNG